MNQPNNIYLEEKCDEEDDEIQQIILNNQKNFERGNLKKISQSISAHANLDFQFKHKKLLESDGREEEENKITNNKLNCEDGCHVDEEDSDEELYILNFYLLFTLGLTLPKIWIGIIF
ncbi:unnamed protein product [Meloidogyne enterolobii]|uniref:Uncharacterized protein n=1 Tax=Meloidogyne enterolobii TaxID=390850 RepID=A0ACB1A5N8_MELEN